jgi:high-affinity iron transporter
VKIFAIALTTCLLFMVSLSSHAMDDARNFDAVINNLILEGNQITEDYDPRQTLPTSDRFSRLYFDQFESSGLEFRLSAVSPELTARIELGFGQIINSAIRGVDPVKLEDQWSQLKESLLTIPTDELNHENWLGSFTQSLIILLREGVEAILLIALLVTLLARGGHGDKIWLIWAGAGTALLASIAGAYALNAILANAGKTREMMEGIVLMVAAALLCYVSLWLLSQRESKQWQQFLHQKIQQELQQSNQVAVFFMAFIAVFREGAETILFYQALMIETQTFDNALLAGALTAAILLVGFYFGMNKIVRWVRLDYFFKGTAILLFFMAVIFTGKGVMELQISGLIAVTTIQGMGLFPMLGIFPTIEGLGSQAAIIVLYASIFFISYLWKNRTTMQTDN